MAQALADAAAAEHRAYVAVATFHATRAVGVRVATEQRQGWHGVEVGAVTDDVLAETGNLRGR